MFFKFLSSLLGFHRWQPFLLICKVQVGVVHRFGTVDMGLSKSSETNLCPLCWDLAACPGLLHSEGFRGISLFSWPIPAMANGVERGQCHWKISSWEMCDGLGWLPGSINYQIWCWLLCCWLLSCCWGSRTTPVLERGSWPPQRDSGT